MQKPNNFYGVDGVAHLYPADREEKGVARISKFSFSNREDPLYNLRVIRDHGRVFQMFDGNYVRLVVNGELVMSDTPMERNTNKQFIEAANGRVLIAGLGVGLILNAILKKPEVTKIVVVEKYKDVIDLVSPRFTSPKIKYVCADIMEWISPLSTKYDTIYFDIWSTVGVKNLDDIKILHNRFRNRLNRDNPRAFMNSWMKKYCQNMKTREARDAKKYGFLTQPLTSPLDLDSTDDGIKL